MLGQDKCANCTRAIDGTEQKFCPACGQPTPAHRIDWHFLGHELEHSVLHMDRGILYSLKHLMLRPGHLMRDYIEGLRGNQVKPLLLLMIMAAVVVLLSKYFLGGDVMGTSTLDGYSDVMKANAGTQLDTASLASATQKVYAWMNAHFTATTLLLLPFEAAAFWLAFRRVGKLNYPEWLVIVAFLTVQVFVFWAVLILLQRWVSQAQLWVIVLSFAYTLFSLAQYFRGYPRWKTMLRAVLGFMIFMLMNYALTFAAVAVVLVLSN
jgi:hypothetical protein